MTAPPPPSSSTTLLIHARQWVERTNVGTICTTLHAASFQRNVQPRQVAGIVAYLRTFAPEALPSLGVITVAHLGPNTYCVDGQHRLRAYAELAEGAASGAEGAASGAEGAASGAEGAHLLVLHHVVATFAEVRDLFAAVNQCVAVPDFLLTEEHACRQMVVKRVCQILQGAFRPYFVHTTVSTRRVNRPKLRPHELEEHLFQSTHVQQTVDRIGSTAAETEVCAQALVGDIQELNAVLRGSSREKLFGILDFFRELKRAEKLPQVARFAARVETIGGDAPFYLGMFASYTWLAEYDAVRAQALAPE